MGRILIHTSIVIQPQGDGSFAATSRELPIMVVGSNRDVLRGRVEELAREYVRRMESAPQGEYSAWLEDLSRRGAHIQSLDDGDTEIAPLALFAHA